MTLETHPGADRAQRGAARRLWQGSHHVDAYDSRTLRPAEVALLVRYRDALSGRVLELGCGAGRVTGYLTELSPDVCGLDVSKAMIARCRATYPAGTFAAGDLRDLSRYDDGAFDVVFATYNVLDYVSHDERPEVLSEISRLLAPAGLLLMSSHNLAHAPRIPRPTHVRTRTPMTLAADLTRLPLRVRNARRLAPFELRTPDYAILNDDAHDHAALHYYVARGFQEAQLADLGYEVLECLALDGRRLPPGDNAEQSPDLHYAARNRSLPPPSGA